MGGGYALRRGGGIATLPPLALDRPFARIMKFRSTLLVALMVIVPGLAMFSHHVPAGAAEAARRIVVEPVAHWVEAWRGAAPARGDGSAALPLAEPKAGPPIGITEADRAVVRERFQALGAVALECRPAPGEAKEHVASCRVPLDAEGQLQRVFQATGHDPLAAERRLLDDVTAWLERQRSRP